MTAQDDWANSALDFSWGKSELSQRLRALEELAGTQAELIRRSGIEGGAYKMAIKRGSSQPAERIGAIAKATGVTLDYLIFGTPITANDAACEEMRFNLAVRDFPLPSSPDKRESRLLLIAQQRRVVDDQLAILGAGPASQLEEIGAGAILPPAGYVLIAPLIRDEGKISDQVRYSLIEPAPLALTQIWLEQQGLGADGLRYLTIKHSEGGPYPAGTILLIDTAATAPRNDMLFAMDFSGEVQLRRIVRRLGGELELRHVNPAWPAETIAEPNQAPILGKVAFSLTPAG